MILVHLDLLSYNALLYNILQASLVIFPCLLILFQWFSSTFVLDSALLVRISSPNFFMITSVNLGRIVQIIGPVMDVEFPPGKMPNIYNSLVVAGTNEAGVEVKITCEVQQLLGEYLSEDNWIIFF